MWKFRRLQWFSTFATLRLVADLEKGESLNVACKIRQGFDYIHGAVPRLLGRLGPASEFSVVCCRAKANVQWINQDLQEFAMSGQQPGMQNQIHPTTAVHLCDFAFNFQRFHRIKSFAELLFVVVPASTKNVIIGVLCLMVSTRVLS